MANTSQQFGQKLEQLRQESIEGLESFIISKRRSGKEEIIEKIEQSTGGLVKAKLHDSFTIIITTPEGYSKKFLLFKGDELDPEETIFNDVYGLCEYIVNKVFHDYYQAFLSETEMS